MNGVSYVLDSNIIIYLTGGDRIISSYMENSSVYISFISGIELYSFHKLSESDEKIVKKLLSNCVIIDINER